MPKQSSPKRQSLQLLVGFLLLNMPFLMAQVKSKPEPSGPAGAIFQKAAPAVVLIQTYDDKHEVNGAGSGFIVSSDGKILTNYHVIAHTKEATVLLQSKDAYDSVDVLDIDKRKDIALIKIKAVELPYLKLGRSAGVEVGDPVYSLSSPLGLLQNTLSQGIISGIREGEGYSFFQTTAPISHGSSGGPIFNSGGEVIGISTATLSEGQNLNFAIPIDYAKGMLAYPSAPRSLASIYEPEPDEDAKKSASSSGSKTTESAPGMSKSSKELPKAVGELGIGIYLERQMDIWTSEDAYNVLGAPHSHRLGVGNPKPDVWVYDDPSRTYRQIELSFDGNTKKLHDIFLFPWNATWEDAKKLWGSDVNVKKYSDGTRVYMYKHRNLNVFTTASGSIVNISIYSAK